MVAAVAVVAAVTAMVVVMEIQVQYGVLCSLLGLIYSPRLDL